jgi:hypothetical protein
MIPSIFGVVSSVVNRRYRSTFTAPKTNAEQNVDARLHHGTIRDSVRLCAADIVVGITDCISLTGMSNELSEEAASNLYNRIRTDSKFIELLGIGVFFTAETYLGITRKTLLRPTELLDLSQSNVLKL